MSNAVRSRRLSISAKKDHSVIDPSFSASSLRIRTRTRSPSAVQVRTTTLTESPVAAATSTRSTSKPTPTGYGKTNDHIIHSNASSSPSLHFPITAVPSHLAFNPYILHYYRKCPLTIQESLYSTVGYIHNETFNIFSHLFGAIVCGYWVYVAYTNNYLNLHHSHYLAVALADLTSMFCFTGSFLYHTFMNVPSDKPGYVALMQLDVWGIWIVNSGAALVLTHTLFPCGPHSLGLTLIVGPIIGSWLWIVFLAHNPASRAKAFGICWLVRVLTIIFSAYFEIAHWSSDILFWHLFSEMFPFIGALINVKRWPERYYPGIFDRFGQSHNLMHICVAIGMLAQHYLGTHRSMFIDTHPPLLDCVQKPWELQMFWSVH